jgi:peptidoglycan/xylan/chitin deacetylase (PgdA/CDA1 family)
MFFFWEVIICRVKQDRVSPKWNERVSMPYGVMFHHFHGKGHIKSQGSISDEQLDDIIRYIGRENILPADEWYKRAVNGTLKDKDICLTFDDNLKCQFDVAYPVLRSYNLTAFWFVYTSPLLGHLENLEIFRYFRFQYFANIDDFYSEFCRVLSMSPYSDIANAALKSFYPESYLSEFPFYTENDRKFRFLRDEVLGPARYNELMNLMISAKGMDKESLRTVLWMSREDIRELHSNGHVIGLHTHTHPTAVAKLSKKEQMEEYSLNRQVLSEILGVAPTTMSHPTNSYNNDTLEILKELGIVIGFRANMAQSHAFSMYEFPREDHVNILREMIVKA